MRTKLLLLLMLFAYFGSYAQIPSINETKINHKSTDSIFTKLNTKLYNRYYDLLKEEKAAESLLNNPASTEKIKTENTKKIEEIKAEKFKTETEIEAEKLKIISISNNYNKKYKELLEKAKKELYDLKKEHEDAADLDAMDKKLDEIVKKEKEIERLISDRYDKLKSVTYSAFLPTLKKKYRNDFFEATYNNDITKTSYLNSISISGDDGGAIAQSEIITDNISAFRISFGTVITATSNESDSQNSPSSKADEQTTPTEETEQDALKRLINGGGNFYAELIFPLITTYDGNSTDLFTSYSYASLRGAMDLKGYGNNIDTSTGNGSFGINSYIGVSSNNKKFNFFLQGNINYSFGSNDFYKNLGIKDEQGFLNGKIITGVTLLSTFKLTAIINTFGSDEKLRNGKVLVGVQVLPGF